MVNGTPIQGDIIKINLNPKQGHEQQGYRPYICLSNKIISDIANIAVFAPISNTKRNYPLYVKLRDTKTTGSVLLDQIVTIDYNAINFEFVESVADNIIIELLAKVVLVFQPNENKGR
ncbi:MAG: type II toxin-antitoxin system PemK/MazF family toxin [Defluviitaleaceae bacterium]|nr:type II toxin-antitoxin system PemK/MazF family toxin [Defluviitaleaceae bacterium]MCL2263108.1 type II toxin-antitoxin system PemK/MazF family toxin [Defluviitaleaceae bacterium]